MYILPAGNYIACCDIKIAVLLNFGSGKDSPFACAISTSKIFVQIRADSWIKVFLVDARIRG